MRTWLLRLDVSDIFRNEDIPLRQRFAEIARRVRALNPLDSYLQEIAERIEDAQDVDEFDEAWDEFYDWADHERCWVETHSPQAVTR
jgi:hypothetical protein